MSKNSNLRRADKEKQDEFYTRLEDVEKEMKNYKEYFKNKIVFCNCDDPYESNFFKYFAMNFNYLGLKKLIATCYCESPVAGGQLSFLDVNYLKQKNISMQAYKIEINKVEDLNNDGAVDLSDVKLLLQIKENTLSLLTEKGDFRSSECIELLKECDVVVTNPPFSLFREYVAQLIEYDKKFIILGNQNAITYKEIFPLLKNNLIWLGINSGSHIFQVPKNFERNNTFFSNGIKFAKFGNICWFTNIDNKKRSEELVLYKKYNSEEYVKYDNYNAINVNKISDIPFDYYEAIGVPITIFDKYNPNQFEIIDGIGRYSILNNEETKKEKKYLSMINNKALYFRIIIKRKR